MCPDTRDQARHLFRAALGFIVLGWLHAAPAWAQDAPDFYAGRTVSILVGSGPGGLTDTSARLIGRFLERHLPGAPTVIVQNMPGGGSVTMANYVFRSAPRDGTVMGYPSPGMITAELLEPDRAKYEGRRLNWIGSAFRSTNTISVLSSSAATTLEDARRTEIFLGASGRGSPLYQIPALARALLDLQFTIVTGYESGSAVVLAMERGEVDGQAIALDFWANSRPHWLADGSLVHLLRIGPPDPRRAAQVPHLRDLVTSDRDKALIDLVEVGFTLGWPLFASPEVPAQRIADLRNAFARLVQDPEFAAAAMDVLRMEVDPILGEELDGHVDRALSTPAPLVNEAIRLLGL